MPAWQVAGPQQCMRIASFMTSLYTCVGGMKHGAANIQNVRFPPCLCMEGATAVTALAWHGKEESSLDNCTMFDQPTLLALFTC